MINGCQLEYLIVNISAEKDKSHDNCLFIMQNYKCIQYDQFEKKEMRN